MLADAAGPRVDLPGLATPDEHPTARLIEAGSHPDMRLLERLEHPKTGALARNITVDQVRGLAELFDLTPSMSPWRAVVIDAVDDLEKLGRQRLAQNARGAAAPIASSCSSRHAPGRLLPTIRSRCRMLIPTT